MGFYCSICQVLFLSNSSRGSCKSNLHCVTSSFHHESFWLVCHFQPQGPSYHECPKPERVTCSTLPVPEPILGLLASPSYYFKTTRTLWLFTLIPVRLYSLCNAVCSLMLSLRFLQILHGLLGSESQSSMNSWDDLCLFPYDELFSVLSLISMIHHLPQLQANPKGFFQKEKGGIERVYITCHISRHSLDIICFFVF